jgi:hypothetical protein
MALVISFQLFWIDLDDGSAVYVAGRNDTVPDQTAKPVGSFGVELVVENPGLHQP